MYFLLNVLMITENICICYSITLLHNKLHAVWQELHLCQVLCDAMTCDWL